MSDQQMIHLRSTLTGRLYRVLGVDDVNRKVTLKGLLGIFTQPWDPKAMKEMGYERIIGPVEGAIPLE